MVFQGMRLALVGVVVGLASAFGLARLVASFLFGVKAWDPLVFVERADPAGAGRAAAVWFPAGRASRVDPVIALRT